MKCDYDCHDYFPQYGVAPHTHNMSNGTLIGSTQVIPNGEWPNNFIEDPQEPGLGIWYCPKCMEGHPDAK